MKSENWHTQFILRSESSIASKPRVCIFHDVILMFKKKKNGFTGNDLISYFTKMIELVWTSGVNANYPLTWIYFFHFPQLPFYPFISGKKKVFFLLLWSYHPPSFQYPWENYSPISPILLFTLKKKSQNVFKIFVKSDTYKYPIRIRKQKVTQNPTTWNHCH